ncbi:MAG: hypothetical protein MMC33_003538 [Icmadophila ericetorum]|nr:hypothetical protein [Icmadophila ericetorum]
MSTNGLKSRAIQAIPAPFPDFGAGTAGKAVEPHPAGRVKHGGYVQVIRMILLADWFNWVCTVTHVTQWFGTPLYILNRDYYYAYMALTKQSFSLLMTSITQWFSPTLIRVSGDASVTGQLRKTRDGMLETNFPERMVMLSNHQLYTDWLYLWWIAYTNRMHGHIYIILKESLKYIPIIGPGIMFYGFVFMARHWEKDKSRLQHRLQKLKSRHSGPLSGQAGLDPMWLMIFPEGTNLSGNTRKKSAKWAESQGMPDLKHQLLPRSTGLYFCLQELKGTVDWVYDCTIAYEGIPEGGYGQDYFTLRSTYIQGRPPKSVNMYWRRFALSSIPLDEPKSFEAWLFKQWLEKDELLEQYVRTGRFPPLQDSNTKDHLITNGASRKTSEARFIESQMRIAHWYELNQIFAVLATFAIVAHFLATLWNLVSRLF